jgi:hypothetical protein
MAPPRTNQSHTPIGAGTPRLTFQKVESIEEATARFGAEDANHGGDLTREGAVGQLNTIDYHCPPTRKSSSH